MSLPPGTHLGPYKIVGRLGAGGMGEVYRALDSRLDRPVALKTIASGAVPDAGQRARFEREARAVSSLNHPHICVLHDIGSERPAYPPGEDADAAGAAAVDYFVMELLEGDTLAGRLAKGPMPVREVVHVGAQIADALDKAHRSGLVHRDLKPANIMLVGEHGRTGQCLAKLLDFGLARPGHVDDDSTSTALTMATQLTRVGAIVGTAPYMSPEQFEGRRLDGRSDIWSLGATLYEMVTGERAFQGERGTLISAVLRDEPRPMLELAPLAPPALERAVRQCLAKHPDDRWQTAGDLKRELEWIAGGTLSVHGQASGVGLSPAANPAVHRRRVRLAWVAAALLAAAMAAGAVRFARRGAPPEGPWAQFTQLTDSAGQEASPSISPDGSMVAYASVARGSWDLYVQRVRGRNATLIAGEPERHEKWPAFSPDGQLIAFSESDANGGVFAVGATGESVRRLTDFGYNPAWSPDGRRIVFCTEEVVDPESRLAVSTLWVVDLAGGAPVQIETVDAIQPAWSPSGKRIAFWTNAGGQRDIATIPAGGGERVLAVNDAALDWAPTWSPDGRALYFSSDRGGVMGLWRVAIDEASGRTLGQPAPVASGVDMAMDSPRLSADGASMVFRSRQLNINPASIAFDPVAERAGAVTLLLRRTGILRPTHVSPDGRWLAISNQQERQEDLFVMRTDGTGLARITDDPARDRSPRFTPSGDAMTFYSNRDGRYEAWMIRTDGSGRTKLSDVSDAGLAYPMVSPDGSRLVATDFLRATDNVFLASPPWPFRGQSATRAPGFTVEDGTLMPTLWSPDGRYLSGPMMSTSGAATGMGIYDVTVGRARKVSADVSFAIPWLPDSRRLVYFAEPSKQLVVLDVTTGRRSVVPIALPLPPGTNSFAVAPDGRTLYYAAEHTESNIWKVERIASTDAPH